MGTDNATGRLAYITGGRVNLPFGKHDNTIRAEILASDPTRVEMYDKNGNVRWTGDLKTGRNVLLCGSDVNEVVLYLDLDKSAAAIWN